MFKTLFKHDMSRTAPIFGILFAIMAGSAVVGSLIIRYMDELAERSDLLAGSLFMIVAGSIVVLCGSVAAAVFITLRRYYRNLFTDEGYLTFTLPVKTSSIIISKFLMSVIWIALTAVVLAVCAYTYVTIAASYEPMFILTKIGEVLRSLDQTNIGVAQRAAIITEVLLVVVMDLVADIFGYMLAVTLGGNASRKHPFLMSLAFWFVISIAQSVVSSVIMATIGSGIFLSNIMFSDNSDITFFHMTMIMVALLSAGFAAAEYLITRHILTKKLNLQ